MKGEAGLFLAAAIATPAVAQIFITIAFGLLPQPG